MKEYAATWLLSFAIYLALVVSTGQIMGVNTYISAAEILAGIFVATVVSASTAKFLCESNNFRMANPARWFRLLAYIFPFFVSMAKANFDVAYRVITGKIRPGIVKFNPNLKTPLGKTLLANSITLTPGTLTVHIDEEGNYYVHWIYVKEGKEKPEAKDVCGTFPKWARGIAE